MAPGSVISAQQGMYLFELFLILQKDSLFWMWYFSFMHQDQIYMNAVALFSKQCLKETQKHNFPITSSVFLLLTSCVLISLPFLLTKIPEF